MLVGKNESGKTAFLEALRTARSVMPDDKFNYVDQYPRKELTRYEPRHKTDPDKVVTLEFELEAEDIEAVNGFCGLSLVSSLKFTQTCKYDNATSVSIQVPTDKYVAALSSDPAFSTDTQEALQGTTTIEQLAERLAELDLNETETQKFEWINETFMSKTRWGTAGAFRLYLYEEIIAARIPKFVYFDDYFLLPGKVSLPDLQRRLTDGRVTESENTVVKLLDLAGVNLEAFDASQGYEPIRARLEGISNAITDTLFKYWKQNKDLDVEFDVKSDPADEPPFNTGDNLYIRIRNRRHRVSVPFSQRSKGFIWFFSFIAYFDQIQAEMPNQPVILLLDEPGLSLHAMAQDNLFEYISDLSENHQIIYTTHSPFMIRNDQLAEVRTVQDRDDVGTIVSGNISLADPDTVFPLQAALGYTIAQNLFIGKRNLLVEGPADLIYLSFFSSVLESRGRDHLRDDIVIVPVGGAGNISTFVSLLGANRLELVSLLDYSANAVQTLDNLVREKTIAQKQLLWYSEFRGGPDTQPTDIEDLITPSVYMKLFSAAFESELNGRVIKATELPPRDRIISQIDAFLDAEGIVLRQAGGFNHYRPASFLASRPFKTSQVDNSTLDRFVTLFRKVNGQFST